MKVSAQPFEPPVAPVAIDAADRARDESHHQPDEGVQPIASVQTQLNPATRESLSKLALLIRSQMRANEKADEDAKEESKERAKLVLLKNENRETEASLQQESVVPNAFPNVVRATQTLRAAEQKRGFGVYGRQKSNALAELVFSELGERIQPEDKDKAAA